MNLKKDINKLLIEKILDEAYGYLKNVTIIDYVIGVNYVAVQTEAGVGLAYNFPETKSDDCCINITELTGYSGAKIADFIYKKDFLLNSILVATINSVLKNGQPDSTSLYEKFDFTDKVVGMVGDFKPLTKNIRDRAKRLDIFELKNIPGTIKPSFAKFLLKDTDFFIITGSTFVNFTTDDFIHFVNDRCKIIFVGPTTPLSKALAELGYIAGAMVSDGEVCLNLVKKGAGMHALKNCITKMWVDKSNF